MWLFLVPQGHGCHLSELKTMKGKKKKSNGCQSEVMPLLCLLLWQAELSSLNEFVVCLEQATSFIKNSQNTTPHLNPMPYESWSSSKDSLFPSETGILSWLGGLFFWGFVMGNRLGKQWALWHALLPCTDHLPGKKANSPPVWSSSCYWRFGGVIGGSLLPIGTKSWVTPMLYAAQQSFGGRVWRLVRSCIHLS